MRSRAAVVLCSLLLAEDVDDRDGGGAESPRSANRQLGSAVIGNRDLTLAVHHLGVG